MELLAAVDLHRGHAVRLSQGDFERGVEYGDPLRLARSYEAAGARWVHIVDLDAARTGEASNRRHVLEIAAVLTARVQAGGGIRSAADAAELLDGGVDRVVLGTAGVRDPELVAELAGRYPGRVVVGVDHRGGGADVAVSGWQQVGGTTLAEILGRFEDVPLAAVVVTAIERDGMLGGPDVSGLADVLSRTRHDVVASGGVRSVEDLRALGRLGLPGRRLWGAIVGKALVEGVLRVEEALSACEPCG